jgi:hypothetical protein
MDVTSLIALVVSGFALVISSLSAWYTRRSASVFTAVPSLSAWF